MKNIFLAGLLAILLNLTLINYATANTQEIGLYNFTTDFSREDTVRNLLNLTLYNNSVIVSGREAEIISNTYNSVDFDSIRISSDDVLFYNYSQEPETPEFFKCSNGECSLSMWLYLEANGKNSGIFTTDNGDTYQNPYIEIYEQNTPAGDHPHKLHFRCFYSNCTSADLNVSVPSQTWMHVLFEIKDYNTTNSVMNVYLNGKLNRSSVFNGLLNFNATNFKFFDNQRTGDNIENIEGRFYCFRYYNESASSLLNFLYNNNKPHCDYANGFNLFFYKEIENALFGNNEANISVEIIGNSYSNFTVSNSQKTLTNLQFGDYVIVYKTPSYSQRIYYVTYNNTFISNNDLKLYLLKEENSTTITTNLKDQNFDNIENATIQVLRYYIQTNTYELVEMVRTSFDGTAEIQLQVAAPFYKFRVIVDDKVKQTTIGTLITSKQATNGISFQVNTESNPLALVKDLESVSANITYDESIPSFTLEYTDEYSVLDQACLRISKYDSLTSEVVNQSCSDSSSGSIVLRFDNSSGGTYIAESVFDASDSSGNVVSRVGESITRFFDVNNVASNFGNYLLYIAGLFVITVGMVLMFDPRAVIIGAAGAVFVPVILGFTLIGITTAVSMFALVIILSIIMKPEKSL